MYFYIVGADYDIQTDLALIPTQHNFFPVPQIFTLIRKLLFNFYFCNVYLYLYIYFNRHYTISYLKKFLVTQLQQHHQQPR